MDSPDAPPAPDYAGAAAATAAGNLQNLNAQTWANRPTQVTPWGSSTWTSTTDTAAFNRALADWEAAGSDESSRPTENSYQRWTQNMTLTPAQQAALNDQQQIQANQSDLAMTLQGQVADTMADGFNAPSMSTYLSGVPGVQSSFSGFNPTGVGSTNTAAYNLGNFTNGNQGLNTTFNSNARQDTTFSSGTPGLNNTFRSGAPQVDTSFSSRGQNVDTNVNAYTQGAGRVDLTAPEFNQASADNAAKAAYAASTGLLKDQWEQDTSGLDAKLRMQGLVPGTEAYNNAAQNLGRVQAQQQNQLANQAVLTGNDIANQNYASALSGYRAGNEAQNQAFTQGLSSFGARNTALGQQFGQDLSAFTAGNAAIGQRFGQDATSFGLTNDARNQSYQNALAAYNSQNAASATQFGQDQARFNTTNAARTQDLQNDLSRYEATLAGQDAYNSSQQQAYNQALASYGANTSAQQMSNAAQQQAYEQAMGRYNTAYQSAYQQYMMPLNSMQAVLNGQQVGQPNMPGFATAGYTGGADMTGAANSLGAWNQGIYNSQVASTNSNNAAIGALGAAALMAF